MPEYHLVVSNPPHGGLDFQAAAKCLGCAAADVRMKSNFTAPEIWLAEADLETARETATGLLQAGARVALVPGKVLAAVPGLQLATAVTLDESFLSAECPTGPVQLDRASPVVAVFGEPPQDEHRVKRQSGSVLTANIQTGGGPPGGIASAAAAGGGLAHLAEGKLDGHVTDGRASQTQRTSDVHGEPEPSQFLDLYVHSSGGWQCVRFAAGHVDFSGLGAAKQAIARANLKAIGESFERSVVDERLVNVHYRRAVVAGKSVHALLGEIDQELGELPLTEVGSRLAFLTSKSQLKKQ